MTGVDGIGLILVNDTCHPFHVDGDVDPHGSSRVVDGSAQGRLAENE